MRVEFVAEKVTKNTVRFAEVVESDMSAPKVGSVYIPKSTLGEIGFKEGMKIVLEVSAE